MKGWPEMSKLQFELVAPDQLLFSDDVEMVIMPGSEGYLGALPNHAPLATSLQAGLVAVYNNHNITHRFFVDGGFANINETGCTILADSAIPLESFNLEKLESQLNTILADHDEDDKEEISRLQSMIHVIKNADTIATC